jgi:Acetyltransferases, including N-acetylases of ribosomal proteins
MFSLQIDKKLRLELPEPDHAEAVNKMVRENLLRLQEWMPWSVDDYSVKHATEWIQRTTDALAKDGSFNALILLDGEIVGTIGFHNLDITNKHAAIGYWIDQHYEGKGIITRCTSALIEYLFSEVGLNRIQINCHVENRRSRAVPERLGFTLEGIQREVEFLNGNFCDWAVYSLIKSEWKSPDAE